MTRSIALALSLTLAALRLSPAADERRITNASDVRLRSAPSTDAPVTAELVLGTELVVLERSNTAELWYHVRTDDRRDGWILGRLTSLLDPARRSQIIEALIAGRLESGGSFSTRLQLFDFIERAASGSGGRKAQARFALYRLRSMSEVLNAIPFRGGSSDPYAGWLRDHASEATYAELRGQWMVDPKYVQHVHDEHQGTAGADDIAWFYVTNGLFGECEGSVPCYVNWENELNGWYLRSHPRGSHADESNAHIAEGLNGAMDNLLGVPAVLAQFDPKTSCGELHALLDPLTAAVTASTSARKSEALAALERYSQLCK